MLCKESTEFSIALQLHSLLIFFITCDLIVVIHDQMNCYLKYSLCMNVQQTSYALCETFNY